jgi:hypothetical protein
VKVAKRLPKASFPFLFLPRIQRHQGLTRDLGS